MRFLSLFSGIEAASVAWHPLGWECAAVAEIEKFPCAVLKHHYPETTNLGDVTKITQEKIESLGQIDVVIFGFPCQDLSVAGKRKGLENADGTLTRSGLFFHAEQISRWAKARWTVAENVPGLFSSNEGRDFATVVGELAGTEFDVPGEGWRSAGVALGPRGLVEWCVLDAQYFGLAQRRKRVFLVRDSGTQWQHRPPLFLKPPSMWRDSAPSRQTREGITHDVAPCIGASGRGFDRTGDTRGQDAVIPIQEIGKRQSGTPMNGVGHGQPGDPMFTLQAAAVHGIVQALPSVSPTLRAGGNQTGGDRPPGTDVDTADSLVPVAYRSSGNCGVMEQGDRTAALNTNTDQTQQIVAFEPGSIARNAGPRGEQETVSTLRSQMGDNQPAVRMGTAVRRLTPVECERLMGFPDNYTKIPDYGKLLAEKFQHLKVSDSEPIPSQRECPDGPRYRALGNSFAVPVVKWIGQQIDFAVKP